MCTKSAPFPYVRLHCGALLHAQSLLQRAKVAMHSQESQNALRFPALPAKFVHQCDVTVLVNCFKYSRIF